MPKPAQKRNKPRLPGKVSDRDATQKEQTLELFLAGTDACVALLDADLKVIKVSDAYARARGEARSEFPGTMAAELYSEEELHYFERARKTGKPARITARQLHRPEAEETQASYWDCLLNPVRDAHAGVPALLITETNVTSQVRAEGSLHQMARILAAIGNAQELDEPTAEGQQSLNRLLADTLHLTGSEYGFIGQLIGPEDGRIRLRIPVILNFAAEEGVAKLDVTDDCLEIELPEGGGLLGQVLQHGRAALANDPAEIPLDLGLPAGHPPLTALLCLPLESEHNRGIICVANSPDGYDSFLPDALRPLLKTYLKQFDSLVIKAERDTALFSLDQSTHLVSGLAVPAIESEHDTLIELINLIYEEVEHEGDHETIIRTMKQLEKATSEHFLHEELLMDSIGYAELDSHRENHQQLLRVLRKHITRYQADPDQDLYPLKTTLTTWFGKHFSTYDLRMNQQFQKRH